MIEAIRKSNGLIYVAAHNIGCDPGTIYDRAKKVARLRQAIDDCRGKVIDQAENKLFNAIEHGEPWAIALVLRTLGKHRGYTEKSEIEYSWREQAIKDGVNPDVVINELVKQFTSAMAGASGSGSVSDSAGASGRDSEG